MRSRDLLILIVVLNAACGHGVFETAPPPAELHVAVAANLTGIFPALATAEQHATGVYLVPSYGSTAQLTQQIIAGAPFDLFLAADTEHPATLAANAVADAPREYARGRVAIWAPKHGDVRGIEDLSRPDVKTIAIASPELAPYGKAAVEALQKSGIWDQVKGKVVYARSISAAQSYVDTGNADVGLIALSLVAAKVPAPPLVPATLHAPIVQSLCALRRTSQPKAVQRCIQFLEGPEGRKFFQKNGYE